MDSSRNCSFSLGVDSKRRGKPRNLLEREHLTVFILAGGRSTRMGRDKASLLLSGRSFVEIIRETAGELGFPVEVIREDLRPGLGPLGGVHTALAEMARGGRKGAALFLSCDMPIVNAEFLQSLVAGFHGTPLFTESNGKRGFPFIIPLSARKQVERQIDSGDHSLRALSEAIGAESFRAAGAEAILQNVNTPADYKRIERFWTESRRSTAVFEVRKLAVRRGKTHLVTGFSWKVNAGEHWVVLGANGCGKTSLFAAMLGYLTPTRGDIFVLGEEYGQSDWPNLRQQIGLVSSSIRQMMADSEPAWITVASGRYAMIDYWGTPKKKDQARALEILREIDCAYLADRPWAVLSQGERQRVLIGRALMSEPALLILDEPCAGLDPAARETFLQFLDRLGRRKDAPSLVLVTHHVEEIMPVFTHGLLMKSGTKLAEGTIGQVLRSNLLTEAFGTAIQLKKNAGRYSLRVKANSKAII